MTGLNYEELGLKVGFEIHQELDTHKLFCNCPSELRDEEPSIKVNRELRPTESELGEIDQAALAEAAKNKKFRYEVHPESVCLVELDEEPPHPVNEEAIDISIEASLMLNAIPVDEAQVMRKTVIDGSNTAGFQRTILIATNGHIEVNDKEISLPTICLEEDAARKIEEKPDFVKYRLDRLGIPLLEIATGPDFNDPETVADAAEKIGQILRATGKVKRGIGTIRQDINVSIEEGARQEIKGVQELSLIITVIEREVQRQAKLLEIKDELVKRGVKKVRGEIFEVTEIFSDTQSEQIRSTLPEGGVFAVRLDGFGGLLGKELIPGRRFGTELSDYAKVYGEVGGVIHTDELPGYGITEDELKELKERLRISEEDAVVMIADEENKAKKGLEAVVDRASKALEGVPEETRRALPDGNTEYMRPLPGAARMYVETDVPPIKISEDRIEKIRRDLPEKPEAKKKRYLEDYGLSDQLAEQMSSSDRAELFEEITEEYEIDPTLVASTLEQKLTELKGEGVPVENITEKPLKKAFELVSEGEISKDALPQLLKEIGKGSSAEEAVDQLGIRKMEKKLIHKKISEVVEEKENIIKEKEEKAIDALMGIVMKDIGGKADGELVHEILREEINKKISK